MSTRTGNIDITNDMIIKKIHKLVKDYGLTGGTSKVIYVFDKDKNMARPDDHMFVKELP